MTQNQIQLKPRPAWLTGNDYSFIYKALQVVKYPEIDPRLLASKSNLDVEWQCDCGLKVIRNLAETAKIGDAKCAMCLNSGTSLFEYEVRAHLKAHAPDIDFLLHQRKDEYRKFIDIYVPQLDLAIELDPYRTHFTCHDRDVRVLAKLKEHYAQVFRVRDERLPAIYGSVVTPADQAANAKIWAERIQLHPLLLPFVKPIKQARLDAFLKETHDLWVFRSAKPENSLDAIAGSAAAYIANVTRPGRRIDYTPQGSNDAAEWRCLQSGCNHVYEQRVYRWVEGIRCPKHKAESIRQGRRKGIGNANLRLNYPELYLELVRVVNHPEIKREDVSARDHVLCEWICSNYGHSYQMAPNSRLVNGSGCTICLKLTGTAPLPEPIEQLDTTHPELAAQFVRNITHPLRGLEGLTAKSVDICEWSCPADRSHPTRISKVSYRTRKPSYGGCRICN